MGLNQDIFAARRQKLMAMMAPNSIAVIPAALEKTRSRDTDHHFRQDSDFFYLSGFDEPQALLVLVPGRADGEFLMFCRERNKEKEIWEGLMAGPEGALAHYGANESAAITTVDERLPKLFDGIEQVYYPLGQNDEFDQRIMGWLGVVRGQARAGAVAPTALCDVSAHIHKLRIIKCEREIELMRASCELAAKAHVRAMKVCKPGMFEYQLEAEILHTFAMSGARHAAYNTIVGGGKNACILHYTENTEALCDGDLVLIDAGCERDFYAADITRTFPVNGTFSEPQAALYQLVLDAQKAALDAIAPGRKWNEPHDASVKVLTEGLVQLGLLEGDVETLIEQGSYKRFYMHRVGHWLGMDVHDVGAYKVMGQWRFLEPGMAMTVEPGLYVAADDDAVDAKWRGIGIRIEDDVVVTESGCEVLTDGVPKTIADIEALMAS
ncbi:MAG TPA: Xaa-Pro aminopeptidase [Marinagarivorans sp.]